MPQTETFDKPSEFTAWLDPWGIYDAAVLDRCQFDTSKVPTFTQKQTEVNIANSKTGGQLDRSGPDRLIYGYTSAAALARQFAGKVSGKMGRGFSHRENTMILREAGF